MLILLCKEMCVTSLLKNLNDKHHKDISHHWYAFLIYGFMFAFMIFVSIFSMTSFTVSDNIYNINIKNNDDSIIFYNAVDDQLITDLRDLQKYGHTGRIYTVIPDDLSENLSLCFKSDHIYFSADILDNSIYTSIYDDNNIFYTHSMGTNWHTIHMNNSYKNQKLYFNYKLAYDDIPGGFTNIMYETSDDYMLSIIKTKAPELFICCIYIVVGLLLVIIGLITARALTYELSLFWLGALALAVAVYCFLETQLLQIFMLNRQIIHVSTLFAMLMIPLPAVAYGSTFLHFKSKFVVTAFATIDALMFVVLTVLNITNIFDYRECLIIVQTFILLAMFILAYSIINYIIDHIRRQRKVNIYSFSMILGLLSIIVTGFIDVMRFWSHNDNIDAASFVRIGFLGFFVCFAIASSERIVNAFKNSSKAKFMAKLAYEDGLTGLKNRTSYQEKLETIEINNTATGVVMMDLNNLKYVNDTFGHDDGDEMIVTTANMIKDAFNMKGATCYRIGGDEFVVLIQNDDIEDSCISSLNILKRAYREFNAETEGHFKIIIAAGYSVYKPAKIRRNADISENESEETYVPLKDVIDQADALMYQNKRELKKLYRLNIMI